METKILHDSKRLIIPSPTRLEGMETWWKKGFTHIFAVSPTRLEGMETQNRRHQNRRHQNVSDPP